MKTHLRKSLETEGQSAPALEYRGAETTARFADPQTEWTALQNACAVYDLGFRAKLLLAGRDRTRWLNGMVSNNIRDLAAGNGVYAFVLTPQGHIMDDLYAYNRGESLVLDTDQNQTEKLLATFKRYIIMDKVELSEMNEQLTAIGVAGPKSLEILKAAGIEAPELTTLQFAKVQISGLECTLVRGDLPYESYEMWIAPEHVKQLWDALVAAGAVPVGAEIFEMQRVAAGIPLYGVDIRERDLPQETEQLRALNFKKGCYIGQEIVERIRARGNVHRKFTGFAAEGSAELAAGAKVMVEGSEAGEITSATSLLPVGDSKRALGYIRREFATPGREVAIGGSKARVVELPRMEPTVVEPKTVLATMRL